MKEEIGFLIRLLLVIFGGAIVFYIFGTPGWVSDGGDGILRFFTMGKFSLAEEIYQKSDFMISLQKDTSFWHSLILWLLVCIICATSVGGYLLALTIGVICIGVTVTVLKQIIPKTVSILKPKPMPCQIN